MNVAKTSDAHEFLVSISGIDLAPPVVDQINRAIQQAALAELGKLELQIDVGVRFPFPPVLGIVILPPIKLAEANAAHGSN